VLDLDEYAENAKKYNYSENLKQTVDSSVKELIGLIEHREFPFNLEINPEDQ
jgi:protein associated with RNAse G/E